MSKKFKKILVKVIKYLIPIVIGWIEGDTHTVADGLSNLFTLF